MAADCPGDIAVRVREVLANVRVPLAFSFSFTCRTQSRITHHSHAQQLSTYFLFLGAISAGLFILIAGYIESPSVVIVCMCFAGAAAGIVYAGFQVNMLDIAPRNASIVMGIANATANTAGFLSPMLVGFITHNKVSFF